MEKFTDEENAVAIALGVEPFLITEAKEKQPKIYWYHREFMGNTNGYPSYVVYGKTEDGEEWNADQNLFWGDTWGDLENIQLS